MFTNDKINKYLIDIEFEFNVQILLACETGSRAWGFPSPDSDFDIRFIYKHNVDWYLSLNEQKDTIEMMFENNEIDLSGWDLKKSLNLLWKSNSALMERIQSPIIYKIDERFVKEINQLSQTTYSKIATMYHYLSMAKNMFADVKDNENVKLKKLFYALRAALACKWIEEREEIPPIVFQTMLEKLDFDLSLKNRIYELIVLKSTKDEMYIHNAEIDLNIFIEELISNAEKIAKSLPSSNGNINDLNKFFVSTLNY